MTFVRVCYFLILNIRYIFWKFNRNNDLFPLTNICCHLLILFYFIRFWNINYISPLSVSELSLEQSNILIMLRKKTVAILKYRICWHLNLKLIKLIYLISRGYVLASYTRQLYVDTPYSKYTLIYTNIH